MTRTARRTPCTRRAATACGGALLAFALTACGTGVVRTGAAAVVGSDRITTEELSELSDRALADPAAAQLAGDRAGFQRQLLQRLVQEQVVAEAARRRGLTVTEGQVDTQYASFVQQSGGPEPLQQQAAAAGLSLDQVRGLARTQALVQVLTARLGQESGQQATQEQAGQALTTELRSVAEDLDITVNPRFGRWDVQNLEVVERGPQPGRVISSPSPAAGSDVPTDPLPGQAPVEPTEEPEVLPSPTA